MDFEIKEYLDHLRIVGKDSVKRLNDYDFDYLVNLLIKSKKTNLIPCLNIYDERRILMMTLNTYIKNRTNENAIQIAETLRDIFIKVLMPEIEALFNEKNMEKERSEFYKTRYKFGLDESSSGYKNCL